MAKRTETSSPKNTSATCALYPRIFAGETDRDIFEAYLRLGAKITVKTVSGKTRPDIQFSNIDSIAPADKSEDPDEHNATMNPRSERNEVMA